MPRKARTNIKPKTHKGLAKRVRVTATGKVVRRRGGSSHLLSNKSGKQCRNLRRTVTLSGRMAKAIKRLLCS